MQPLFLCSFFLTIINFNFCWVSCSAGAHFFSFSLTRAHWLGCVQRCQAIEHKEVEWSLLLWPKRSIRCLLFTPEDKIAQVGLPLNDVLLHIITLSWERRWGPHKASPTAWLPTPSHCQFLLFPVLSSLLLSQYERFCQRQCEKL